MRSEKVKVGEERVREDPEEQQDAGPHEQYQLTPEHHVTISLTSQSVGGTCSSCWLGQPGYIDTSQCGQQQQGCAAQAQALLNTQISEMNGEHC